MKLRVDSLYGKPWVWFASWINSEARFTISLMSCIFLYQFYYLWFWIFFCPLWIREWNQGEDGQKNKKLCKSRRGTFSSCGWAVWAKMAASGLRGEQSWTRAAIKAEAVTVGQNQWDEQEWMLLFVVSAFVCLTKEIYYIRLKHPILQQCAVDDEPGLEVKQSCNDPKACPTSITLSYLR